MDKVEFVKNTPFYKQLNELLREEFIRIKQDIGLAYDRILKERQFEHFLPIICQFEWAVWSRNKQWRLELDFDDYEWSNETIKPHFLNAIVSLDIGEESIHFKYQLCSSFNEALEPKNTEKIELTKLNDDQFVDEKIEELKQFLKRLPDNFLKEVENIDFSTLEFVEDLENIYQIINLHKTNDTEMFYNRTQLLVLELIELMEQYINDYEVIILGYVKRMYSEEIPVCTSTLKSFRIILAQKKSKEENISENRALVLDAINGFLLPFEEYNGNDKIQRPYELEYKVDFLVQAGLTGEQFEPVIKKHFPEI